MCAEVFIAKMNSDYFLQFYFCYKNTVFFLRYG